ncbi:MAG TPA: hypothetical protein VNU02_23495 [Candidatus Dormibacteraeota bacterium]|jgi:hypothetical protein|nr:hypothetical protein [Candidatus Dormibacteraeota bacterium]
MPRLSAPRTSVWLTLLVLPALCAIATAQDGAMRTSPSELLGNVGAFNGKTITVSGAVVNLQEGVSKAGKGYYTFDLSDGAEAVHVLSTGKARCKVGRATVDGTFDGVRRQIISTRVRWSLRDATPVR